MLPLSLPSNQDGQAHARDEITRIVAELEEMVGYENRAEVATISFEGGEVAYRKRYPRDGTQKFLDGALAKAIRALDSFSITTKLSPSGRLCVLGCEWNALHDRKNKLVTVTFRKTEDQHKIAEAVVWSEQFTDNGARLAEERITFENGKFVSRSTDLSFEQVITMIRNESGYQARDTEIILNANGQRFTLKRDHTPPTISELLLASKLKALKYFSIEATLNLGGSLKYLGFEGPLGVQVAGRKGIFHFTYDDTLKNLQLLRYDVFGLSSGLTNKVIYTVTREGRVRNKERVSSNATVVDLIAELRTLLADDPLHQTIMVRTPEGSGEVPAPHRRQSYLGGIFGERLKIFELVSIEFTVPGDFTAREFQAFGFTIPIYLGDRGSKLLVQFERRKLKKKEIVQ